MQRRQLWNIPGHRNEEENTRECSSPRITTVSTEKPEKGKESEEPPEFRQHLVRGRAEIAQSAQSQCAQKTPDISVMT
eukprot:6205463-Pleurochrysis_carterae.AAC.2